MAISVTHAKVSAKSDGGDSSLVLSSDWNAGHVVDGVREVLSATRTYYVRTDGSNSNDGLANTSGGAWLTMQYAYDYIANNLDLNGYVVTIQVADGTYANGVVTGYADKPIVGGVLYLRGNLTTPANIVVNNPIRFLALSGKTFVCVSGFQCTYLETQYDNKMWINSDPAFSEFGGMVLTSEIPINAYYGGTVEVYGNYTITDTTIDAFLTVNGGLVPFLSPDTITAPSPVTVANAFYDVTNGGIIKSGYTPLTVTGTITGPRVRARYNSFVAGDTGDQTFAPGNSNGTVDTGSSVV